MNRNRAGGRRAGGVITAWLSLIILLLISVILVCLESARTAVIRTSAERYADMAAEMTFSAYVRPLADRYGIFVLDTEGKDDAGDIFARYLKMNLEESDTNKKRAFAIYGTETSGRLVSSYGLRDDDWNNLYEQMRRCQLYTLGAEGLGSMISFLKGGTLSRTGQVSGKLEQDLQERAQAARGEQEQKQEEEKGQAREKTAEEKEEDRGSGQEKNTDGSGQNREGEKEETDPRPGISRWLKQGLLHLVMGDEKISSRRIDLSSCSYRTSRSGRLSLVSDFKGEKDLSRSLKSSTLTSIWEDNSPQAGGEAMTSDRAGRGARWMLLNLYILDRFRELTGEGGSSEESVLKYEVEYILFGNKSDQENLESTISSLCALRLALNLAWLYTDEGKTAQVSRMAGALAGAALPAAGELIQLLLLACWAGAEAVVDCRALTKGKKIPLWKSEDSWQLTLSSLKELASKGGSPASFARGSAKGLTYRQYLLILLLSRPAAKKIVRMLQLMEKNVQLTDGYEEFRFKHCLAGAVFEADTGIRPKFFRHPGEVTGRVRAAYGY